MDDLLKTLSGLYTKNYQDQTENSKSFKDMLRERRQFVQNSENQFGDFTQGQLSSGVPVSPAAMDKPVLDYHTNNANTTNDLVNQGFRMDSQALDSLKALTDLFTSQQSNSRADRELGLKEKELKLQYGLGDDGETSDSGVVAQSAKNILNGTMKLSDVPQNIRSQVGAALSKMGYDPGTQVNGLVDNLEKMYFGDKSKGDKPLAQESGVLNPRSDYNHIAGFLGTLLNTPWAQRNKLYNDTKGGFAASLKALTGDTGVLTDQDYERLSKLLPTNEDTEEQAQAKMKQLRTQINAKFAPGKNKAQSEDTDPLNILK